MKRLLSLLQTEGPLAVPANRATIAFAQQFAKLTHAPFDLLVAGGPDAGGLAESYRHYGAERVLYAAAPELAHASPQAVAKLCAGILGERGDRSLAGPATQFGTDTLACASGLLGLPMLSSVHSIEEIDGQPAFCVMSGHRKSEIMRVDADRAVFSVARTSFNAPIKAPGRSELKQLSLPAPGRFHAGVTWRKDLPPPGDQDNLQTARIVVAGGRALVDATTFDRLIGGLAEKLGGAKAATGAAVQAGIAPSELLIGQTGQAVSPDLYIAAGISGSDQHAAGFRDAKVVVAINSNPNATIFRMADYGLVADVHQALPELIEKL